MQTLREEIECKRKDYTEQKNDKKKPNLIVEITSGDNCWCQQNQEKFPGQHYHCFKRTLRKRDSFCLNELIVSDQKVMLNS